MENLKMNVVKKFTKGNEKSIENRCNSGRENFWAQTRSREITEEIVPDSQKDEHLIHHGKIGALLKFHSLSAHCRFILHKKMRIIFLMSKVSGLSYDEIATSLSIDIESFKAPIKKATQKRAPLNQSDNYI